MMLGRRSVIGAALAGPTLTISRARAASRAGKLLSSAGLVKLTNDGTIDGHDGKLFVSA